MKASEENVVDHRAAETPIGVDPAQGLLQLSSPNDGVVWSDTIVANPEISFSYEINDTYLNLSTWANSAGVDSWSIDWGDGSSTSGSSAEGS